MIRKKNAWKWIQVISLFFLLSLSAKMKKKVYLSMVKETHLCFSGPAPATILECYISRSVWKDKKSSCFVPIYFGSHAASMFFVSMPSFILWHRPILSATLALIWTMAFVPAVKMTQACIVKSLHTKTNWATQMAEKWGKGNWSFD